MLTSCIVATYLLQLLLGTDDVAGVLGDQTQRDDSFRLPSPSVFTDSEPMRSVITVKYRRVCSE